jgi:RNA recognition motif-containing protein
MADGTSINTSQSQAVDITQADDSKKVFVGGLHWEATDEDLREHFSQFGNVVAATIKMDRNTGKSRGFGFILYEDTSEVEKAMNAPEHIIKGKRIDPKQAKPPLEAKKKVFVGGIDPDTSEEQIRQYFSQYGKIDNLDLPFDKNTSKRRAYIFVTYSTENEAREAAKNPKQDIFARQCDVRIAIPQEQVNRQKGWSQQGGYGYDSNYYPGYEGYSYPSGYGYGYGYDPNSYDPNAAYAAGGYGYSQQGYYDQSGYDYYNYGGYSDPSYGAYPQYPPARGGGKMRGGASAPTASPGRGGAAPGNGAYHPYAKQ